MAPDSPDPVVPDLDIPYYDDTDADADADADSDADADADADVDDESNDIFASNVDVTLGNGTQRVAYDEHGSGPDVDSIKTVKNFEVGTDKLVLPHAEVAADLGGTEIANLTASVDKGVVTFDGSFAENATLEDKVKAIITALGGKAENVGFVHEGDAYIVEGDEESGQQDTGIVVKLAGVTTLEDISLIVEKDIDP